MSELPKVRISLYRYGLDFYSFVIAFKSNALQQGWTPFDIESMMAETDKMNSLEATHHLMNYCVITKLQKGYRISKKKKK